jgi:hypothetical protein
MPAPVTIQIKRKPKDIHPVLEAWNRIFKGSLVRNLLVLLYLPQITFLKKV